MPRSSLPTSFSSPARFRAWLERRHAKERELLVRCWKTQAKSRGMTYAEALDEALCFGWIDGVRRSFDEDSFTVRFTPRKPNSKWSAVNVRKVRQLEKAGRMHSSGVAAFQVRDPKRAAGYSFEEQPMDLAPEFLKQFRASPAAWEFFQGEPPGYRRTSTFWVMSAKKEATRARRFAVLFACSSQSKRIPLLARNP